MSENKLTKFTDPCCQPNNHKRDQGCFVKPAVDLYEAPEGMTLVADVPGLDDKSLEISLEGNVLNIEGQAPVGHDDLLHHEFSLSGYRRQFKIPEVFDVTDAKADIKDGVLTLFIPRAEAAKPKRIEVTVH